MSNKKLKILMVHNRYKSLGGEDVSTRNEIQLLRDGGHEVELVEYNNNTLDESRRLKLAIDTIWSKSAVHEVGTLLDSKKFDLLHIQNFFPIASPAIAWAASKRGVATVQSLRNYRLMCVNGLFYRNNENCQTCKTHFAPWFGVLNKCYRDSYTASSVLATMVAFHNSIGTWRKCIDAFIPVSEYVRNLYIEGGFDPSKLHSKPNVLSSTPRKKKKSSQVSFVGRLEIEKGIRVLLEAWRSKERSGKLVIVGDGILRNEVEAIAAADDSIEYMGHLPEDRVLDVMAESKAVIVPSVWEEPFGRIIIEAFASGTPVIGTNRGGVHEILNNGLPDCIYEATDPIRLSELITRLFVDQEWAEDITSRSEKLFEDKYSKNATLRRTEEIYQYAIEARKRKFTG